MTDNTVLRERAEELAAMVWNAADDLDFLQPMLVEVLFEHMPGVRKEHEFLLRGAFCLIARELAEQFPDRARIETRDDDMAIERAEQWAAFWGFGGESPRS